jgi:hypothetical protein
MVKEGVVAVPGVVSNQVTTYLNFEFKGISSGGHAVGYPCRLEKGDNIEVFVTGRKNSLLPEVLGIYSQACIKCTSQLCQLVRRI